MKKIMSFLNVGLLIAVFLGGCGSRAMEDGKVQARNLTTGEMQTFSAEGDVPDGYLICSSDECPVPDDVPCELLGAEVCQLNLNCRIKVVSCSGGGSEPTQPMNCVVAEGPNSNEPGTCEIPVATETCEVTCISNQTLLCSELADETNCAAHPECQWEMFACATCVCAEGMDCDCPPCTNQGVCIDKPTSSCGNLDQQACGANPTCTWSSTPCVCGCPANVDCDCMCDDAGFCMDKFEPAFCETQNSEAACLASPECEWGQFICPITSFDDPAKGGAASPWNCELSCRTKQIDCPAIPAIMVECPGGLMAEPIFDPLGCLIDWQCGILVECPAIGCELYCANGFAQDEHGCEVCSCR